MLDTRDGLWPLHVAVSMATTALRLTSEKKANRATVNEVCSQLASLLYTISDIIDTNCCKCNYSRMFTVTAGATIDAELA